MPSSRPLRVSQDRQHLHHPLPHPLLGGGARRKRAHVQPDRAQAEEAAAWPASFVSATAKAFGKKEMVSDPAIDCVWVCGPNHARVENLQAILAARQRGADLVGIAIEELARDVAEAKTVVQRSRVPARYLEDQLFSPASSAGTRSSGHAARRSPVGPISHVRPRTAGRTRPGSGGVSWRGVASSRT